MYDVVSADAGVADHRPPPSVVQTLPPMPVLGTAAQSEVDVHEMAASQEAELPGSACGDQVAPPSVLPNTAWVGKSPVPVEPRASHTSADGHEMPMTASRPETTVAFHDAPPSVVERTVGPEPPATQSDAVGQDTVVNAPSTSCDGWLDQSAPPSVELTTVPFPPTATQFVTVAQEIAVRLLTDADSFRTVQVVPLSWEISASSEWPTFEDMAMQVDVIGQDIPTIWPTPLFGKSWTTPQAGDGPADAASGEMTAEVAMAIRATRTRRPTRTNAGRRPSDARRAR